MTITVEGTKDVPDAIDDSVTVSSQGPRSSRGGLEPRGHKTNLPGTLLIFLYLLGQNETLDSALSLKGSMRTKMDTYGWPKISS